MNENTKQKAQLEIVLAINCLWKLGVILEPWDYVMVLSVDLALDFLCVKLYEVGGVWRLAKINFHFFLVVRECIRNCLNKLVHLPVYLHMLHERAINAWTSFQSLLIVLVMIQRLIVVKLQNYQHFVFLFKKDDVEVKTNVRLPVVPIQLWFSTTDRSAVW